MSTLQNFGVPPNRSSILQPKVKFKFRVIATNFGVPSSSIALTQQVVTVGKPKFSSEEVEVNSYNSRAYFGGKPKWESIQLTVRDDVTNSVNTLVSAQLQRQMNFFAQTTPLAAVNYKFQMLIDTLDGGGTSSADAAVLEEWTLEGCYLTNVEYGEFDYASSEPLIISMTIRMDNCVSNIMPLNPILTNPGSGFID